MPIMHANLVSRFRPSHGRRCRYFASARPCWDEKKAGSVLGGRGLSRVLARRPPALVQLSPVLAFVSCAGIFARCLLRMPPAFSCRRAVPKRFAREVIPAAFSPLQGDTGAASEAVSARKKGAFLREASLVLNFLQAIGRRLCNSVDAATRDEPD